MNFILKSKHHTTHADWLEVWNNIERYVTREECDKFCEETIAEIKKEISGKRCAYAWSGGKDSLALQYVCEQAGVFNGVLATASKLQFDVFNEWLKKYTPKGIKTYDFLYDLDWLKDRQSKYLFPYPNNDNYANILQIKAQDLYIKQYGIEVMMYGRRTQDGNMCGENGKYFMKKFNCLRYNPIAKWKHEQVLAVIKYKMDIPLCDTYFFEDGFINSAFIWANWIKTPDKNKGWELMLKFQPSIVYEASKKIESARVFLENKGLI